MAETKTPESYDELFPGRFLKSALFKGRTVTLTIAAVSMEKMPDRGGKDGEKWKATLSFRESEMQLVLNKTNGECIKGMFGARLADWVDKRVAFYPRQVRAFGQTTMAIRVLGSPDISKDVRIELNVGLDVERVTMKKTPDKKTLPAPSPEQDSEEAEEFDPQTGEVAGAAADAPF
jgi:hypothetical protein